MLDRLIETTLSTLLLMAVLGAFVLVRNWLRDDSDGGGDGDEP